MQTCDPLGQSGCMGKVRVAVTRGPRAAADVDAAVGARVRSMRASRGVLQEDLARSIGVSAAQLHKYECGSNRISAARLRLVAEILQAPIATFFEDCKGTMPESGEPSVAIDHSSGSVAGTSDEHEVLECLNLIEAIPIGKARKQALSLIRAVLGALAEENGIRLPVRRSR